MRNLVPHVLRIVALASLSLAAWSLPASAQKVFPLPADKTCTDCHDQLGQKEFVHAPVEGEKCLACHVEQTKGQHGFRLRAEGGDLCLECHDKIGTKEVVHSPVENGKCLACHDPHESDNEKLLKASKTEICLTCHDNIGQKDHVHTPVEDGKCLACHNAHDSDNEKLLFTEKTDLCRTCHDRIGTKDYVHTPVEDGKCTACHDPHESDNENQLVAEKTELCLLCHERIANHDVLHPPVEDGKCTACHNPHDSDHIKQLIADPGAPLCFTCHKEDRFEGSVTHGPVADGKCLSCHDPHGTDNRKILTLLPPDLCFRCHDKAQKDPSGTVLPPPKLAFDNEKLVKHKPFGEGTCTKCHQPHASENYRLLNRPYPKSLYAAFSTEDYMCFECHKEEAFTEPRTLTATKFRNGNLNLHYRHVNKEKKGRSCRACHEHHAARHEKLIRDQIPFGRKFIDIKDFSLTETGGTCAPTCHKKVSWDRYSPVDNMMRVTPRKGKDATPEELKSVKQ